MVTVPLAAVPVPEPELCIGYKVIVTAGVGTPEPEVPAVDDEPVKVRDDFVDSNTYYDDKGKYLAFIPTETSESKSFVINDFLFIPMESNLTDSKIEWRNELGISVETSIDGTTYLPCVNGDAIPQYKKGSFVLGPHTQTR